MYNIIRKKVNDAGGIINITIPYINDGYIMRDVKIIGNKVNNISLYDLSVDFIVFLYNAIIEKKYEQYTVMQEVDKLFDEVFNNFA